jgi:hypothetical protein
VGYNRWRVYPEDAFDFQTWDRAHRWMHAMDLADVEIVQAPSAMQVSSSPVKNVETNPNR